MKGWLAGGVLALGLPTALVLNGSGPGFGFRHRRAEMMEKFIEWRISEKLDELKATDAQKQQVKAIEDRLVTEGMALRAETKGVRAAILGELEQDTPDAARIHSLVDGRAVAMKGFAHKVVDGVLEARGVLTPEQRQQLFQGFHEHRGEE